MNTVEKLNKYAEIKSALDLARLDYEAQRKAILATVQDQLDALEVEYQTHIEPAETNLIALEVAIKAETVEIGASVKGSLFQAVFTKGRVTWDTKALDGFAAGRPEILQFRKVGEPSVSIRANGK